MLMLNKALPRIMWGYFLLYFGIAVGQFLLFTLMRDIMLSYFISALLWVILLVYSAQKVPQRRAWFIFGLLGLFTKTIWILFVQTEAISDYSLMLSAAQEIVNGQRDYLSWIYFQRYPYQMGFTSYQALLLSIFNSVEFLKFVNVLWCVVASLAVYGIAKECFSQRVAVLAMLLHVTMLPILVLSSVLTNQHIAVAWLYIGIYIWLKAGWRSWPLAIVAGAALAIGNAMRPIGIVVIVAIVVNALIQLLRKRSKDVWLGAGRAAVTAVSYAVMLFILSTVLIQSGISPEGLRNNDTLWKFVVGFNAEKYGTINTEDEQLLNYGKMDPAEREALEKEIIAERLTSPRNMAKLPFVKIGKMWADHQPDWFTWTDRAGTYFHYLGWTTSFDEALERYRSFERAVFYLLMIAAFIGILRYIRQRFDDDKQRLLMLITGAYTFIHLLVEVQARYLYFLFGILLIFSAVELLRASDAVKAKWERLFPRETVKRE